MAARVPSNGEDPTVRRAGKRTLHASTDAWSGSFVQRRRGRRRGHLRNPEYRRLHYQYPPRPRTLPGQGRFARPYVCRVVGKGSWILPWQRGIDAHRRSCNRKPGCERHRGRKRRHRYRRGFRRETFGERTSGGLLFRRRRTRSGIAVRSDEPGATLEVARDLCLRKQSLLRIHALLRDHSRNDRGTRRSVWGGSRSGRRPGRARRE